MALSMRRNVCDALRSSPLLRHVFPTPCTSFHTSLKESPTAITSHTSNLSLPLSTLDFRRPFSTTMVQTKAKSKPNAKAQPQKGGSSKPSLFKGLPVPKKLSDRRIRLLRYFLHHPTTLMPRPLRFGRQRYMRHWTIQRAWSLYSRQQRENQELELQRQYQAMRAACEELRVGLDDGGHLYRQAINKKGIFGGRSDLGLLYGRPGEGRRVLRGMEAGIPIEYARGLTDGPPRNGWDENWKRDKT